MFCLLFMSSFRTLKQLFEVKTLRNLPVVTELEAHESARTGLEPPLWCDAMRGDKMRRATDLALFLYSISPSMATFVSHRHAKACTESGKHKKHQETWNGRKHFDSFQEPLHTSHRDMCKVSHTRQPLWLSAFNTDLSNNAIKGPERVRKEHAMTTRHRILMHFEGLVLRKHTTKNPSVPWFGDWVDKIWACELQTLLYNALHSSTENIHQLVDFCRKEDCFHQRPELLSFEESLRHLRLAPGQNAFLQPSL